MMPARTPTHSGASTTNSRPIRRSITNVESQADKKERARFTTSARPVRPRFGRVRRNRRSRNRKSGRIASSKLSKTYNPMTKANRISTDSQFAIQEFLHSDSLLTVLLIAVQENGSKVKTIRWLRAKAWPTENQPCENQQKDCRSRFEHRSILQAFTSSQRRIVDLA